MTGGKRVKAFVPTPLPPHPPLVLDGPRRSTLEAAAMSLGRLDGMSSLLPEHTLVTEAVLSSQIEGTQSSLSDLLLHEIEEASGIPLDDVVETANHVTAMEHGHRRLRDHFPLSNRLIREIHGVLLSSGRGSAKDPGEFRRSQNWIGGTRPGNATFVPPPHTAVQDCMGDLELFLHDESDDLPTLVRIALAHVQFETIHPFLDGNGRVGRLLVTLLLLYDRSAIEQSGRRAGSALRVYAALRERPILSITAAAQRANLSFSGASAAMKELVEGGIAREVTGMQRGRLFVYDRYVEILNEGTEVEKS